MNFEVVAFFPWIGQKHRKEQNLVGTVHVKLLDMKLQIRGIKVFIGKKSISFKMPFNISFSEQRKMLVPYTIVTFDDLDVKKNLKEFLRKEAPNFLQKKNP